MSTITLHVADDLAALLHESNQPLDRAALELMVMELYRRGVISSGKAAETLGRSRADFIRDASRAGIPYLDMTEDEWATEAARSASV